LRIEGVIASGSFGVVFRARQLSVARDVAVKVLHAGLGPETEPGVTADARADRACEGGLLGGEDLVDEVHRL
jgi:serine/threonine protein kinase